jgi:glycyl-tRNA synthetase beta chain
MASRNLLLEIGTEEIPARFIPDALVKLKRSIHDELLLKRNIPNADKVFDAIRTMGTPRRLVAIISDLPDMQDDRVEEVFGPPKKAAYDADGNLTKAAIGFARSQGVDPVKLKVKDKEGKGEYICATVEDKGKPVADVLPEALRDVVLSLNFPKSMRWGNGTIRFARPIHWIVALYGKDVVEFELEGIKSGRNSRGHRFLSPVDVPIKKPESYEEALRQHSVIVGERAETIKADAESLSLEAGGNIVWDEELLTHVANIVEYPFCVLGSFDKKYLDLPDELLTAVMVGHQKYIPVRGSDGKLLNNFIIVSNTKADNEDTVRVGAERVIRARFDDARFYFNEDGKKKLSERLEGLKNVTFQDKLGSLHEKTMRVRDVAGRQAEKLCPDKRSLVERAAELSKTDLVSGVVFEFPELQGIMGMHYAGNDGEHPAVAQALREQYLPAFSGDLVPESDVGSVLALADRSDNIASFFSIGLKPTGSEDPFALRRQALGIVSILNEKQYALSISEVMAPALDGKDKVIDDVLEFFRMRIENLLSGNGYAHDLVQAVLPLSTEISLRDIYSRLDALREFKNNSRYNDFLLAFKRVRNIIPGTGTDDVDKLLFKEDEEKALHEALLSVSGPVSDSIQSSEHGKAIEGMSPLIEPINTFFDKVLVMDKDEALRNNRLALLGEIWTLASTVADFSALPELED